MVIQQYFMVAGSVCNLPNHKNSCYAVEIKNSSKVFSQCFANLMKNKRKRSVVLRVGMVATGVLLLALGAYITWRMVRPMSIFVVSDEFALPIMESEVSGIPDLRAETCGSCHQAIYREWKTSIHSQAWNDPLFQAYNRHDGYQQICLNCHTPMQNQQADLVVGHKDRARSQPILENNAQFDADFRDEGVTCAACHVKEGKIQGPFGSKLAPHPSVKAPAFLAQGQVCQRCHLVNGKSWDYFLYQEGPCGTYEDLAKEIVDGQRRDVGCYSCHMPTIERSLLPGGPARSTRAHLWRGGHDREMVRNALKITFDQDSNSTFKLTLNNHGAGHRLPTGAPMRYLQVTFRSYDKEDNVLKESVHKMRRVIIWRPFIIDLWDDRLEPGKPRTFKFTADDPEVVRVEATLSYHLMPKKERKLINAPATQQISYELFRSVIVPNLEQFH